jgi:hypothetical protein
MLRCGDAQRIRDAFRFGITRGGRCRAPDAAGVGSWRLLDYCSFFLKKKFDADVCGARVGTNGGRVWLGACAGLPAGVTAPAHRAMAMEEATDEAAAAV